jgi:hypothetical protein
VEINEEPIGLRTGVQVLLLRLVLRALRRHNTNIALERKENTTYIFIKVYILPYYFQIKETNIAFLSMLFKVYMELSYRNAK